MVSAGAHHVIHHALGHANLALQAAATDPNASTCFRRSYRKNTHFAVETIGGDTLSISAGGSTVTQDVPRIGDVVYSAYLAIGCPGLANVATLDTSGTTDMAQVSASFYAEIVPSSAQLSRYKSSTSDGSGYAVLDGAALDGGGTHTSVFFDYWLSPRWVPAMAMIKNIKLIIGQAEIDELTTAILCVWKELADDGGFRYVEGDYDYALDAINASKSLQIYYLDLPFAFFLSPPDKCASNSLSLVTLAFNTVQLSVTPRVLSSLVIGYADGSTTNPFKADSAIASVDVSEAVTTVVRNGQTVGTAGSATTGLSGGTLAYYQSASQELDTLAFSDISWQFMYAQAFLDNEERAMYSDISYETILTCWDYTEHSASSATALQSITLSFAHPTAAVFLLASSKHHRIATSTAGAIVTANEHQYRNDWCDFSGITEYVTLEKWAPFLGCSIELDALKLNSGGFNTVQSNLMYEQYYRKLMLKQNSYHSPYKPWSDLKDGRKFIYMFTFSLSPMGPDPLQPEGFVNLARVDDTKVKFLLDDQLFTDNSSQNGENLSSNTVDVHVLAFTYNIFRYVLGLGGKSLV